MNSIRLFFALVILSVSALCFTACGGGEASGGDSEKAYTAAYVCPMHCDGSGADAAGTCPACGMDYVAQAEHVKDGHTHEGHPHGMAAPKKHDHGSHDGHDHSHDGHNHDHGDHEGHNH